jgi:hypothetical protein
MGAIRMALVEQERPVPRISDVSQAVLLELERTQLATLVCPGMRIAITAGSRGITDIAVVLRSVVGECARLGGEPFLVPAMGSHGGATVEGQLSILSSMGITEQEMGCPISPSIDVVRVASTATGIPVLMDRAAAKADGIILVNRVKPHTDFRGEIGSGLLKMIVIGLGRPQGALIMHNHAVDLGYNRVLLDMARAVLQTGAITLGVGIVENCRRETAHVFAVGPEQMEQTEKEFLLEADRLMAKLPFERLDLLIVDEIGKEISGTGMDPNVTGRRDRHGEPPLEQPRIARVVVRDLTERSHGNATGVGFADFVTNRLVSKIDRHATYVNSITSMAPEQARIPVVAESDRQAIEWALMTIGAKPPEEALVVRINNTASLDTYYVSEALLAEALRCPGVRQRGPLRPIAFDESGSLQGTFQTQCQPTTRGPTSARRS